MLLTLTIAAAIYAVLVASNGTMLTPDGGVYLAMGRGEMVPRPYAYRMLPYLVRSVMAWRIIHAVSWVVLAMATYLLSEAIGVNGAIVAVAILCLPSLRQSVSWPVLLDVPMLAVSTCVALLATVNPLFAVVALPFTIVVHERAPFVAALYALPFVPFGWLCVAIMAVLIVLYQLHEYHPEHPDEKRIEWLANPFTAAIARHRGTWNNWRVWVQPLGLSATGIIFGGYWQWLALLVGYAGCLVAQDRARIYTIAALPLTVAAVSAFGEYGAIVALVNWFTNTTEI